MDFIKELESEDEFTMATGDAMTTDVPSDEDRKRKSSSSDDVMDGDFSFLNNGSSAAKSSKTDKDASPRRLNGHHNGSALNRNGTSLATQEKDGSHREDTTGRKSPSRKSPRKKSPRRESPGRSSPRGGLCDNGTVPHVFTSESSESDDQDSSLDSLPGPPPPYTPFFQPTFIPRRHSPPPLHKEPPTIEKDEGPQAPTYATLMQEKVELLPIPSALKKFLLFYRDGS